MAYDFNYTAMSGTAAPFMEAAVILRRVVEQLLDALFSGQEGSAGSNKRPPSLASILTRQEARALAELHIWTLKIKSEPAAGLQKSGLVYSMKDKLAEIKEGKNEPREWQTAFQHRLIQSLGGGTPGRGIPDIMLPLLERTAWNDLGFRRTIAAKVLDYMRQQTLLTPGEANLPVFSFGSFWCLIALTETGGSEDSKVLERMADSIREIARYMVMTEGWAREWDLWLIGEAYNHWPMAFKKKDAFSRSLMALPIFSAEPEPQPKRPAKKKKLTAWQRFWKFLLGKKEKEAVTVKKKSDILQLAHPDCASGGPAGSPKGPATRVG
ncbi:MAG: hypothetical protein GY765_08100 [bacterium]|nr:hypothetical protein [bacterium]